MELNRSDKAIMPFQKLEQPDNEDFEKNYELVEAHSRRHASLIDEGNFSYWKAVSPNIYPVPDRYLSNTPPYLECRQAVVNAIMGRCLFIYSGWCCTQSTRRSMSRPFRTALIMTFGKSV